jgi:RHS repeat-associated protein
MGTSKGYTGQYNDPLTGFDYYHARYYDAVAGVFLTPDTVQGNAQGLNPYGYVGGNPETTTDHTRHMYAPPGGGGGGGSGSGNGGNGNGGNGNPPPNHGPTCGPYPTQCGSNPPPTENKTIHFSGCDPNSNSSDACKAWAYDAGQVRSDRLAGLNRRGTLLLLAGSLLFLTGDALDFFKGSELDRLNAILDFLATVVNTVIPYVGQIFGGSIEETVLRFSSWAAGVEATIQPVVAILRSANGWEEVAADITANLIETAAAGPAGVFVQVLMVALKPMVGYLLDSGGHYLQSLGFADLAEAQREGDMGLQTWCTHYGGCPSYSAYQ